MLIANWKYGFDLFPLATAGENRGDVNQRRRRLSRGVVDAAIDGVVETLHFRCELPA